LAPASLPKAMLFEPVVLLKSALRPQAILLLPLTLLNRRLRHRPWAGAVPKAE